MNPFTLPGPQFLLFYFCFSIVVILAISVLRRQAESGPTPKMDLSDPYLIAYLRGGEDEALRVAVISLIDRGALVVEDRHIRRADHVVDDSIRHPVERAILKKFGPPAEKASVIKASSILKDGDLKLSLHPYRDELERAGLMPDAAVRGDRVRRLSLALLALGLVGMIKITIGLSLEKPVSFLFAMMIVAMAVAAFSSFPRLTARGAATLADVTSLYAGLRTRINSINPGGAAAEMTMVAAVFGVGALAATPFAYAEDIFHRDRRTLSSLSDSSCGTSSHFPSSSCSSSDAGSSCGGSSGGGSSCGASSDGGSSCGGGGGCGGCGSS